MSFVLTFLVLVLTSFLSLWAYVHNAFNYWKRKGVPFIKPSFPFGTMKKSFLQELSPADDFKQLYQQSTDRFVGLYASIRPILLIRDPNLIREILIKDFSSFKNRGWHVNADVDPMGDNMLVQSGEKWKNSRSKLSPTFTSGRLKGMFDLMMRSGSSLQDHVNNFAESGETLEIREVFAHFAMNVIANVTFGIEIDCIKNPNEEFGKYAKKFFEPTITNAFRNATSFYAPAISKLCRNRFVDKDVGAYVTDSVKQTLEYREANNITRKDFFQLLMQLRNTGEVKGDDNWTTQATSGQKLMSIDEMTAQAYLFVFAGYESNSTTMSFCLYELAKNQELQQRAYEDIVSVLEKNDGKITYDSLAEMKYVEHCIDETLRLHSPFGLFTRECIKDYKISDSDVIIEKGTYLMFSINGLHYDPKHFEEPTKFDPDRFDEDIHGKRTFAEFPFLAFGDGPRNCIGLRLGKLQSKIGVILMLQKFKFELGDEHIGTELEINPKTLAKLPVSGINLKVSYRH